jgi:hypothetical protein
VVDDAGYATVRDQLTERCVSPFLDESREV